MPLQTKEKRTGGYIDQLAFMSSESWSPARPCRAIVTVVGGGGSGAAAWVSSVNTTAKACVSGGGAGGIAQSRLELDPSVTYTIAVGAAASGPAATGSATVGVNGNTGNASQFSGSGITTMTANGGGGGVASVTTSNVATTAAGGAGGTATGGNVMNVTGGAGGDADVAVSSGTSMAASGAGAPGFRGVGYNGGDAAVTSTAGINYAASGGGGVGGKGANATENRTSNNGTLSEGGGEAGPAPDKTASGITGWGRTTGISAGSATLDDSHLQATGNLIGNWVLGNSANAGNLYPRGVGANATNNDTINWSIFGGGNGAANGDGTDVKGGGSRLGGGSGAAVQRNGGASSARNSSTGFVLIQIEEYLD